LNNLIASSEMLITKSSFSDGMMRWSAINSDTSPDLYGERMSLELYKKMLSYIKDNVPPPAHFKSMVCSDFWCGGMPYVSLAHYSDLNGKAVPGQPIELFIDGERLKAKGIMFDTPLGRAVWKSLKEDEKLVDDEDRIRISIAFLDLAHKHGESGQVFERKSATAVCPQCLKGEKNKIYLDGYLVHLALTRVPVNPRTILEEDAMPKKSQIKTRKEDAVSIVGDEELVNEIEKSALETKSDVLVEMSDTDNHLLKLADTSDMGDLLVGKAKAKKDMPVEEEDSEDDMEEDDKEKKGKGKKECSLTEGDIEVIRSLIVEALPKPIEVVVEPVTVKSDTVSTLNGVITPDPEVKKSALDIATDNLYNSVNVALGLQGVTLEQRLESINPSLQELGNSITVLVRESMGQVAPVPETNEQALILEAINNLTQKVEGISTEVATMKAQTVNTTVQNKMPVPRSIQTTQLVTNSQAPVANPNSVTNIVRRSVSQHLQPK